MTEYTVGSHQISSGIVLTSGGSLTVLGTVVSTLVSSGGYETVSFGGVASGTTVSLGGVVSVLAGGATTGDTLESGQESVASGGTAIETSVGNDSTLAGGYLDISAGGVASNADINDGILTLSAGTAVNGAINSPYSQELVESGGTSINLTIQNYAQQTVSVGGTASNTTINTGGTETLSGGVSIDTALISQGTQFVVGVDYLLVSSDGTAISTTMGADATQEVGSGGVAISTLVVSGGNAELYDGGITSATTLRDSFETIESGSTAIGTVVSSGGRETVDSFGTEIGATVSNGGSEIIIYGTGISTTVLSGGVIFDYGLDSHAVVSSGGTELLSGNGILASSTTLIGGTEIVTRLDTTIRTLVESQGYQAVSSGGTAIITTVFSGSTEAVLSGGTAISTIVLSGGTVIVLNTALESNTAAVESNTVVSTGGTEILSGGGSVASGTTLVGGTEILTSGDLSVGTQVESQGYQVVSAGALARQTTVSGGTEAVLSGGTATHTTLDAGGSGIVAGLASNSIIDGGTLDLLSGGKATGGITFAGSGVLTIQGATMPGTTISSFAVSDTIDLAGVGYTGSGTAAFNPATDVLTVTEGGSSYQLTLADPASDSFALSPDSGSSTFVTISSLVVTGGVPCFAAGTLILTDRGEIVVENLTIGDAVITDGGGAEPIQWIGHRRIACDRHAEPGRVWPVRVEAHAFGPGMPHRDLLLSPDHAILAEGVLIPVKHLINGTTIQQVRRAEVTYFHIQLARHTAILANGLPTETYLDTGDIASFANAPGLVALHPAFGSERSDISLVMDALGYAPFRVTGAEVAAVRTRLAKLSELAEGFQLLRKGGE